MSLDAHTQVTKRKGGNGEPISVASVAPPPVYTDVLGEAPPKPRRKFERLSDADLKRLIGAAPAAHVYGSLDEVVDAWCIMLDLSRTTHLLKVGDFTATYCKIFISLDRRKQIPDENFWPRRVYYLDAKLDAGRIAGIYFVKSINKFTGLDGELPISARVRINSDESSKSANSYNLSDMKTIRIFWHGGIPTLNRSGIGPSYALGGDAYVQFSELAVTDLMTSFRQQSLSESTLNGSRVSNRLVEIQFVRSPCRPCDRA